MYFHWQNLNEDRNGKVKGRGWRRGRAWLHFKRIALNIEWHFFGKSNTALHLERNKFGDPPGYTFHIALWGLLSLFFCVEGLHWDYTNLEDSERTIGFAIFDGNIWLYCWTDRSGWGPDRTIVWHYSQWICGKPRYSRQVLSKGICRLEMPEGPYTVEYQECIDTWKRARGFTRSVKRYDLDMGDGIPIPGKGESSWDIHDTAVMAGTYNANTLPEALDALKESVQRSRDRYGGKGWLPEAKIDSPST